MVVMHLSPLPQARKSLDSRCSGCYEWFEEARRASMIVGHMLDRVSLSAIL